MLDWLGCLLAPKVADLTEAALPALPDPSRHDALVDRARQALDALHAVPFAPVVSHDAHALLMAMGCRDLISREADQHPDTAGRTPNWASCPAFEEVSIPASGDVVLHGRHSVGAPGRPILIVAHGLYDSHCSRYVVEYSEVLHRLGFHVFALDLRDHGRLRGRPPPTSLGLHEGRDLFAVARTLAEREGLSVGILGLSYGGHCAVRAAYEASLAGRAELLRGGVLSISAPLNVHEAVLALDDHSRLPAPRGWRQRLVMRHIHATFRRHMRLRIDEHGPFDHPVDDYESYIRDIVIPACPDAPPLVGAFLGALRCTQPSVLGKVAVPTALLHSTDDLLVPVKHLAEARAAAGDNPFVGARELPAGGHLGLGISDPRGTLALLAAFFGPLRDG